MPTPKKKTFFLAPQWGFCGALPYTKTQSKTTKPNFCRLTNQEPIFPVSNTKFEGAGDGHGHSDRTFLVKEDGSWKRDKHKHAQKTVENSLYKIDNR